MMKTLTIALLAYAACAPGESGSGQDQASSLESLERAFRDHDRLGVERYMDIDRTVESAVNDIIDAMTVVLTEEMADDTTGIVAGASSFALGMLQSMKPAYVSFVRTGIELALGDSTSLADLNPMFGGMADSVDFESIPERFEGVTYVEADGDLAFVGVGIRDEEADSTVTVEIRMEARDGYWQMVGFNNLGEIVAAASEATADSTH